MDVLGYEKKFFINRENALEYADKIGDFLKQKLTETGAKGYVLGLSGGLDSAVAAYIAVRAGIDLYGLVLPYGNTMVESGSMDRVNEVIVGLGLERKVKVIDIKEACDSDPATDPAFLELLYKFLDAPKPTENNLRLARENRRARQRMVKLYEYAQIFGLLVLGTDNLDEHCLGYFTKYGDGASDIEPLQYCLKSEVRILGEALGIPRSILVTPPSAELSTNQTDEGDLGFSYDDFDRFALKGTSGIEAIDLEIKRRFKQTQHKREFPPAFMGD